MQFKIPLFKVSMAPWDEIASNLQSVLFSGFVAEGEWVARFERALAEFLGVSVDRVFCTNSCTSGITIALRAAGVGPGTTVVMPPQTCIATATPVTTLGADIIWADVNPTTGCVDPASVQSVIRSDTRAVIGVRWAGDMFDCDEVRSAMPNDVVMIDDAAQGFGVIPSSADYVCYSFQAIKHLTTGDGGVVVCRTTEMERVADDLSWFGIDRRAFRKPDGEIDWDANVDFVGFKMHMNNIAAAIGLAQLPNVVKNVIPQHLRNGQQLEAQLADVGGVTIPPRLFGSAYWTLSVLADRRDDLIRHLHGLGIQASRMHARLDRYSGLHSVDRRPLPGADAFSDRSVCLPCGWWMRESDVQFVADSVRGFYA